MPMAVISDSTAKHHRRSKIYGLRSFMDPGCPTDFAGAFRDNVRRFVRECADAKQEEADSAAAEAPTWCTLLVDEKSGVVVPLYTVEESVLRSSRPFCDYCRCNGWSHHFVSKRRYHIIIPADDEWDKPLHSDAFHLCNHLLHGLLHCNGFGHLILINGREGGSKFISGCTLMDLWDRLCTSLRIREVTVEDVSRKYSVEFPLLHGITYGGSWFARWGYRFCSGSFGLNELSYAESIDNLSSLPLDSFLCLSTISNPTSSKELHRIVTSSIRHHPQLTTLCDLLRHLIDLQHHSPSPSPPHPPPPSKTNPPSKHMKKAKTEKKPKKCREFVKVAVDLTSRWPTRRLITAAEVIVDALTDHGRMMTRQEVRDASRQTIGDTGLIDFVLKSIGNTIVHSYVVRRKSNPKTRVLEFSLDKLSSSSSSSSSTAATPPHPTPIPIDADVTDDDADSGTPSSTDEDLQIVCKWVMEIRPEEARAVLDAKHWAKTFDLRDEADDLLRFYVQWIPSVSQMEGLTRPLPPAELIVLNTYASIGELKAEVENTMRDTFIMTERFRCGGLEGVEGEDWEAVMFGGAESGAVLWVRGELGSEEVKGCELKYEGGADTWAVGCGCGARDDDGERMVACDACDVWHHTRCIGIEDEEPVPQLFLCAGCGSSILAAAAEDEEMNRGLGMLM